MATSILDLQRDDHAHMQRLIDRYTAQLSPESRSATFRELVDLVTRHAFAEEEVLFPAARRALPKGEALTSEIEEQHQRANDLLHEMERYAPGDAEFERRAAELFPLLQSDARNEEDRLLAAMARVLDDVELKRIGRAWSVAKSAAPNRSHPRVSRRPPGNVLAGIPLFFVDHLRSFLARLRRAPQ